MTARWASSIHSVTMVSFFPTQLTFLLLTMKYRAGREQQRESFADLGVQQQQHNL